MMTSEEEKKKIKHKAVIFTLKMSNISGSLVILQIFVFKFQQKLEHKQSKLRQQNSLQLGNVASGSVISPLPRSDSVYSISTTQSGLLSPPPNTSTTANGGELIIFISK